MISANWVIYIYIYIYIYMCVCVRYGLHFHTLIIVYVYIHIYYKLYDLTVMRCNCHQKGTSQPRHCFLLGLCLCNLSTVEQLASGGKLQRLAPHMTYAACTIVVHTPLPNTNLYVMWHKPPFSPAAKELTSSVVPASFSCGVAEWLT